MPEKNEKTTITEKEKTSLLKKADAQRKRWEKAQNQAKDLHDKADMADGKKKARLLRKVEKAEIKANKHKVRTKQFTERAEGKINDDEWKRIGRSRRNHRLYDAISAITRRFSPHNPLRDEGMTFQKDNEEFTNKGRIFLGGTKAMNLFMDKSKKEWLCKEAVTCVGTYKPMGALVTEAASKLQEKINPDTAIRAFAYRGEKGRVLGSLQEKIALKEGGGFDLFKWQTDTSQKLPEHLPNQILREHVTDWLLCNFDTKGENFLEDAQGRLRGIDKEQALSFLNNPDAQHMSYEFKPNPNDTLYNTVFKLYAEGKMDLDLKQVDQYIRKVEAIPDKEYVELFQDVVKAKCRGNSDAMERMNGQILSRKTNLRAEYQKFFGELAKERGANELLNESGEFQFGEGGHVKAQSVEKEQQYEKPLNKAQMLEAQVLKGVLDAAKPPAKADSEMQNDIDSVQKVITEMKDINNRRIEGKAAIGESQRLSEMRDPVAVKNSGAPEAVVHFTKQLEKQMSNAMELTLKASAKSMSDTMAREAAKEAPAKEAPVKEAPTREAPTKQAKTAQPMRKASKGRAM